MTATEQRPSTTVAHPLQPLSAAEIGAAAALLRDAGHVGPSGRFVSLVLHEPPKADVLAFDADAAPVAREAAAVVLDRADGRTYEAVVSLTDSAVTRWEHVGAYRRALSTHDVKVRAVPLLSSALDEPSAYEVVEPDTVLNIGSTRSIP